jgi:hypothetical protein
MSLGIATHCVFNAVLALLVGLLITNLADSRCLREILHGEAYTVPSPCFRDASIVERPRTAHVVIHPI